VAATAVVIKEGVVFGGRGWLLGDLYHGLVIINIGSMIWICYFVQKIKDFYQINCPIALL